MKNLKIKKCLNCGALVEILQDCGCEECGIKCCGENMKNLEVNYLKNNFLSTKVIDNLVVVKVNHEMKKENYIEWVSMVSDLKIGKKFLKPKETAEVTFPYVEGSKIYAYSSKDGLYAKDVE